MSPAADLNLTVEAFTPAVLMLFPCCSPAVLLFFLSVKLSE